MIVILEIKLNLQNFQWIIFIMKNKNKTKTKQHHLHNYINLITQIHIFLIKIEKFKVDNFQINEEN